VSAGKLQHPRFMNSKPKSQINQDLSDEMHNNSSSKFVFGGKKNGRN
jgi:hypothetical protein